MKKTSWTLYVLLELVLLTWLLLIANPFNWFVKKSSHFTPERFDRVVPGMSKE
ncbi:MAG TPA: hypothetical protein VJ885_01665 [Thermoanaerobaculia bacterium]|nr:hypothetical protein [Thermoanaerobaculia bacterium]